MKLGFQFVPFPREIWDRGIDLTMAEFRLLGWFLAGLRFGIQQTGFVDDDILSGTAKMPAVGLSRNSMKVARRGLVEKELLACEKTHYHGKWTYAVLFTEEVSSSDRSICQPSTANVSKVDTYKGKREKQISTNPPTPLSGGLTNRQLKNLSKELELMREACVGVFVSPEDRVRAAAGRLLIPFDLALAAVLGEAN